VGDEGGARHQYAGSTAPAASVRERRWMAMAALVAADFVLGMAALFVVPFGRSSSWFPRAGRGVYLAHAILGAALGLGALAVVAGARGAPRVRRAPAMAALGGIAAGAAGGALAAYHGARLEGAALMFVGSGIAGLAYLTAALAGPPGDADEDAEEAPVGAA